MPNSGHFVDFFAEDDKLVAAATNFLKEGFARGASCIAILTTDHFDQVSGSLAAHGMDVQQLIDEYRLVALDTSETLETLWTEERLDICAFNRKFSELIRLMSAGGREVYIIGEMVDLLAARGRLDLAMQVEDLCNDLSRQHVFRMYCLYCENSLRDFPADASRRTICATHSGSLLAG
jgi:MEDS: MEthanogen/methylotroph, DcmR Sensory domain